MANVLQEVTEPGITREHVMRRVDDWQARIETLFSQIERWLPPGLIACRRRTVAMDEEMMRHVGVPARQLPVLEISKDGTEIAELEPRGLWIVGTNGRIDLIGQGGHFLIVDDAENFAPPDWRISPLGSRMRRDKLDRDRLVAALS